jgi:hypothetical protein
MGRSCLALQPGRLRGSARRKVSNSTTCGILSALPSPRMVALRTETS